MSQLILIFQYEWSRSGGPLPYYARHDERVLQLRHIRDEDAGRYECRMTYPNGSVAIDYVDVAVRGEYRYARQSVPRSNRWWMKNGRYY